VGIKFDVAKVGGDQIKKALDQLGANAECAIEFGYRSVSTVYIMLTGSLTFGNVRRRQLLGYDATDGSRVYLGGDGGEHDEDEDEEERHHHRSLLGLDGSSEHLEYPEDNEPEAQMSLDEYHAHSRGLLWGKKKKKNPFSAVVSVASSVVIAVEPKNGIRLSVTGTGAYDIATKRLSITAGVSATFCIVSICTNVNVNFVDFSKNL